MDNDTRRKRLKALVEKAKPAIPRIDKLHLLPSVQESGVNYCRECKGRGYKYVRVINEGRHQLINQPCQCQIQ